MMTRNELRQKIYDYVMADEHRLEVFTDHEICTMSDKLDCVLELDNLLTGMATKSLKIIADNIDHDDEFDTYDGVFFGERKG